MTGYRCLSFNRASPTVNCQSIPFCHLAENKTILSGDLIRNREWLLKYSAMIPIFVQHIFHVSVLHLAKPLS